MNELVTRDLGRRPLSQVWADMREFTEKRDEHTADEVWFVEHPPVYTLGLNADESHLLDPRGIEVVPIDRGGQVTYHGPGQLVAYLLLDLRRRGLGIRPLVVLLEQVVIATVACYGVVAHGRRDAPGVYVGQSKLGAIGLRVRRGCSYHGIAVNVNMDLQPFRRINPCGMRGLEVTQLADVCDVDSLDVFRRDIEIELREALARYLPEAESYP